MKRAVVTIACGPHFSSMGTVSHPTIRAYAEKLGAEFIVWTDYEGHAIPAYKKLDLGALLDTYDRILYIDTDILVRDDAPDLFALVPEDQLGIFEEGDLCDTMTMRAHGLVNFMAENNYDPTCWNGRYFNAGVMVLSRIHKNLFVQPAVERDMFMDQSYFNALIATTGTKVFPLPRRFNRMVIIDAAYGEERFDAYFLHYAGISFLTSRDHLVRLMQHDFGVWQRARPHYRFPRHLAFVVQGDIGQQFAAEPTIRYAREVAFASDEIVIVTEWPELFAHLRLQMFREVQRVPDLPQFRQCFTSSNAREYSPKQLPRELMHGVNFASLHSLGLELPSSYKTPRLVVNAAAAASMAQKLDGVAPSRLVLLHSAQAAAADTFAPDVWREYAQSLLQSGYRVAVIGNRLGREFPLVDFDMSGCVDWTDRLSLTETVALVSQAGVLVANDSALIAIAAAFENWIGLVAPSRHPEYVLPWRHGSAYWRAASLERAPRYTGPIDRIETKESARARQSPSEYLPTPQAVLQFVDHAMRDLASQSR